MVSETGKLFEISLQRLMKELKVKAKPRCVLISKTQDAKKFGVPPSVFANAKGGAVVPLSDYGRRGYLVYIERPDPYVVVAEAAHVMYYQIGKLLKMESNLRVGEAFDRLEQFKLALRKKDKREIEKLTKQFRSSYYFVRYPKAEGWDPSLTPITHIVGEAIAYAAIKSGFNTLGAISELQLALSRKRKIFGRDASGYNAMRLVERWGKKGPKFLSKLVERAKKRRVIKRI